MVAILIGAGETRPLEGNHRSRTTPSRGMSRAFPNASRKPSGASTISPSGTVESCSRPGSDRNKRSSAPSERNPAWSFCQRGCAYSSLARAVSEPAGIKNTPVISCAALFSDTPYSNASTMPSVVGSPTISCSVGCSRCKSTRATRRPSRAAMRAMSHAAFAAQGRSAVVVSSATSAWPSTSGGIR